MGRHRERGSVSHHARLWVIFNSTMRLLFVSAQLPGHLDWGGYLRTATQLQQMGQTVLWASGKAVEPLVQTSGVPFHVLPETGWRWPPPPPLTPSAEVDVLALRRLRAERALDQWLDVTRVTRATEALITLGRSFRPDLIVGENFVGAAAIAAEVLQLPFIVVGWPAMPPQVAAGDETVIALARTRLQAILAHFQATGRNWTSTGAPAVLSPQLHLTYWSPRWYSGFTLLPQTQHVGGRAPTAAEPGWLSEDEPLVFITLGTSFGQDANFFTNAATAAERLGCIPIVVLGGQFSREQRQALQARLPANAQVYEHVDFARLLPRIAVAIHHGGAGTTHALVIHGVPQIIVPHAADQAHQAQGIVRSGVGLYLPAKEATADRFVQALAQLLPDLSKYRANAQVLREEFASLGGIKRAAMLLVNQK